MRIDFKFRAAWIDISDILANDISKSFPDASVNRTNRMF